MNAYERVACMEYLSAFPDDKTFDEIMDMILDDDYDVIVWEAFARVPLKDVVQYIKNMKDVLEENFIPREVTP